MRRHTGNPRLDRPRDFRGSKGFLFGLGFEPSPLEPTTLMVTLADLRAAL
jgi:hypothetical protein